MRDVILAAAGEAVDATIMPTRETNGPAEPREDMTAQLAHARSAGEAEGIRQGSTSERARIKSIITSDEAKASPQHGHSPRCSVTRVTSGLISGISTWS